MTGNLQQPPYDTSMMGVVKGALDHYGIKRTPGEAFALSGHAFVINVHEELCPSGPYCWDFRPFFALLRNLGLAGEELGSLVPGASSAAEKAQVERRIRDALGEGAVCSLLNLENQLVLGADDNGLTMAQPWGDQVESTPARLSFGSWREYGFGPPVTFFKFTPCELASPAKAVYAALDFARRVWRDLPAQAHYGLGGQAYANWLAAIDAGHGAEHGNWWNGVVWAECRQRAGDYFQDLAAADYPGALDQERARQLAVKYRNIAKLLYRASDKTATQAQKRRFVEEAGDIEADCVDTLPRRA